MNANATIRRAMLRNERAVLRYIRECEREGRMQRLTFCISSAWANALDRLMRKRLVRFDGVRGYVIVRKPHSTFKETRKGRARTAERRFVGGGR